MSIVTVPEFRDWSGANLPASVSDDLIQSVLDEAEAGIVAEVDEPLDLITGHQLASDEFTGEEKRRANRLLARRNSPEGIAGAGMEGIITIPVRDADSQRAVWHIQMHLGHPIGVA